MPTSNYPNAGMKAEAKKGLNWREEFKRGGTRIGLIRARQIVANENLSEKTIKRMFSFFSRQEGVKKAEGFRPGEKGYPSNGRIAWALWGGDAGFSWSRKLVKQMKDKKNMQNIRQETIEYKVTVDEGVNKYGEGNKYYINGNLSPVLTMIVGNTYIFDTSDTSTETHNLRLSSTEDGTHNEGIAYTDGVTVNSESISITIQENTPNLYYYCVNHSGMGNKININQEEKTMSNDNIENLGVKETDEELDLDVTFTPEIELNETLNNVEVKELETVEINTREAVFPIEFREDAQSRTMTMSVSSESPVGREFGNEILSHRDGDIDLSRLLNKAPLLKDHDMRQQIGVIEDAYLDTQRGKLMTKVRFGRGTLASEQFQDVQDGIKNQVSIGYQINPDSFERSEDSDDVIVRDWMPIEVSLVSSGADQNVGFGRSLSLNTTKKETIKEQPMSEENTIDVEETIRTKTDELMKRRDKEIAEILELGARHNKSELAKTSIRDGVDLSTFRGSLLQEIGNTPLETEAIGLKDEETRSYSIVKVAKAMAHPTNAQYQKDAEFEFECSRAYQEKTGKETKGVFVPEEVQKNWVSKDVSQRVLSTAGGSAGSLVYTDLRYNDLIEALTPFSTVLSANPTVLSGLTGNVSIPRVSATATSGWVAEGVAVGASDPTIGSVTLSQKTGGAFTDVTRTLMTNTDGFSVENMVRNDLARSLGTLFDQASLNNGGAGGAPTGIEQTAGINAVAFGVAGAPTYAEIISMESSIYTDNYDLGTEAKFITTPALNGYMKTLATNGAGSPVASRDGFVDGYQVLISSQVTANSIILGDFSQFLVGVWGGLEITADPYALSTSGGMRIIALSSVDFAVRNPVAFCLGA